MKKVGIFIEDIFDEQELIYPYHRLREDYEVILIGTEAGKEYKAKEGFKLKSDVASEEVNAEELAGVFIPGGYSPDKMRRSEATRNIVKTLHEAGKPVAAVCHAGWVLSSSIDLNGLKMTSTPAIKDDMIHAGANWVDEETVVDKNVYTGRNPDDLPSLMKAFLKGLEEA